MNERKKCSIMNAQYLVEKNITMQLRMHILVHFSLPFQKCEQRFSDWKVLCEFC